MDCDRQSFTDIDLDWPNLIVANHYDFGVVITFLGRTTLR
jgi:hypothetical protein